MTPHPVAKIFAPVVFASLALLSVGFAFTPAQADQPESVAPSVKLAENVPAPAASR